MPVYQIEQYYINLAVELSDSQVVNVNEFIENNQITDYEINQDSITVDGFESEWDAESFESELAIFLNGIKG